MFCVGGVEGDLAGDGQFDVASAIDLAGREAVEAFMAVLVVVPDDEPARPRASMRGIGESAGIVGLVLERLEAALAVRVVVADARATARGFDAERAEQRIEAVRRHRRTAVVVQRELPRIDLQAFDRASDQLLREGAVLAPRDHPADDVALYRSRIKYKLRNTPMVVVASLVMSHVQT